MKNPPGISPGGHRQHQIRNQYIREGVFNLLTFGKLRFDYVWMAAGLLVAKRGLRQRRMRGQVLA
jgi:hypothetical protein